MSNLPLGNFSVTSCFSFCWLSHLQDIANVFVTLKFVDILSHYKM